MGEKFTLDGKEFDVENLSDHSRATLASLQFATTRMQELTNMQVLLQRARNSYLDSLKKEMISSKSGYLFDDE